MKVLPMMKTTHLLAIAGTGVVLTLPVLILGVPFFSDDGVAHAMWYTHFSEQLFSGDLYPRWLVNMNAGLGSPVFFFYPPVPFFLTGVLLPAAGGLNLATFGFFASARRLPVRVGTALAT